MGVRTQVWKAGLLGLAAAVVLLSAAARDSHAKENGQCYLLAIKGMTCKDCAHHVQKALGEVEGVVDAKVDFAKAEAVVCARAGAPVTGDKLTAAVAKVGYKATVKRRK